MRTLLIIIRLIPLIKASPDGYNPEKVEVTRPNRTYLHQKAIPAQSSLLVDSSLIKKYAWSYGNLKRAHSLAVQSTKNHYNFRTLAQGEAYADNIRTMAEFQDDTDEAMWYSEHLREFLSKGMDPRGEVITNLVKMLRLLLRNLRTHALRMIRLGPDITGSKGQELTVTEIVDAYQNVMHITLIKHHLEVAIHCLSADSTSTLDGIKEDAEDNIKGLLQKASQGVCCMYPTAHIEVTKLTERYWRASLPAHKRK